jgi:SAM-dependent methyltransferase
MSRAELTPLMALLACLDCRGQLDVKEIYERAAQPELGPDGTLVCRACGAMYRLVAGTPRLLRDVHGRAPSDGTVLADSKVRSRTAESFAYEWEHFGAPRPEWEENFRGYMQPHAPEWFRGKRVLDVGAGSGRHSFHAHALGADVVAVDLGDAIDVARRNLPGDVLTVQADAEDLPFNEGTFDLVAAIGVLHHLPDPASTIRSLARYVKPGGFLQLYVYWLPQHRWHGALLRAVSSIRTVTTRMPHPLVRALSYPVAATSYVFFVLPYRIMRRKPRLVRFAEALPLKTYADYPFGVCVNDQFDRFATPIEWRFRRDEIEQALACAGLDDIRVIAHHGWVATGRRAVAEIGASPTRKDVRRARQDGQNIPPE